jgi:hypothetical protein
VFENVMIGLHQPRIADAGRVRRCSTRCSSERARRASNCAISACEDPPYWVGIERPGAGEARREPGLMATNACVGVALALAADPVACCCWTSLSQA